MGNLFYCGINRGQNFQELSLKVKLVLVLTLLPYYGKLAPSILNTIKYICKYREETSCSWHWKAELKGFRWNLGAKVLEDLCKNEVQCFRQIRLTWTSRAINWAIRRWGCTYWMTNFLAGLHQPISHGNILCGACALVELVLLLPCLQSEQIVTTEA